MEWHENVNISNLDGTREDLKSWLKAKLRIGMISIQIASMVLWRENSGAFGQATGYQVEGVLDLMKHEREMIYFKFQH